MGLELLAVPKDNPDQQSTRWVSNRQDWKMEQVNLSDVSNWFFTAPPEDLGERRGDPFGLRRAADFYADALAPGFTSGTNDARWITILSWILTQAWERYRKLRDRVDGPLNHDEARHLYAWVQPLELLWIARTLLKVPDSTAVLPNKRAVRAWLNGGQKLDGRCPPFFGLSSDQIRRFRATGPYGRYRGLLRSIGMTVDNDGWRPNDTALALAKTLGVATANGSLRTLGQADNLAARGRYWSACWEEWATPKNVKTLPQGATSQLYKPEQNILRKALFAGEPPSPAARRQAVVKLCAGGESHEVICASIAKGLAKSVDASEQIAIARLPGFVALSDAATDVLSILWSRLNDADIVSLPIDDLAKDHEVGQALSRLRETAARWTDAQRTQPVGLDTAFSAVHRFAEVVAVPGAGKQLAALADHHAKHGGGVSWFAREGGSLSRVARRSGLSPQPLRFRLAALCQVAWQVGRIDQMPTGLMADAVEDGQDANNGE